MKRIVRLTESDLARIVRRVISEQPAKGANQQLADKIAKEMMQKGYGITTDGYGNNWISFYNTQGDARDIQVTCAGQPVYPADDAVKIKRAQEVSGGYYATGMNYIKQYCAAAGRS